MLQPHGINEKILTKKINMETAYLYKGFNSEYQFSTWKIARWGIVAFCFVHWIFEIGTGNEKFMFLPVIANYLISAWFIKNRIRKGKFVERPFIVGLSVSCTVFLIRLVLSVVYTSLML